MSCPDCHRDSPAGARFCMHCAAPLAVRCAGCHTEVPSGARFCPQCAAPAPGSLRAAPDRRPPTGPRQHLAEKILQSKAAIEGERKQVTVLFADVKGSMELAEQLDPEEWSRIMNRFFQILSEGVERFEGFVDKFTGDGIMALFGAPIAHEDHAQRACYAALHLRDETRRHADELRMESGLSYSVRMGLNSGEVVVGRVGDDLRMDYTAQGHVVGLASRMEQLAEPQSIYLTQHTAKFVSGYFRLRDLGHSRIKGVSEALQVYELEGLGTVRTRLEVSRTRGFSKFVGRADAMATLEAALTRALAGQGQVVGVVADAGIGKSRLCFEFLERCRARNVMATEGRAVAHAKNVPFLPMLQVFRAYFGITDQDVDRTAREKIAGRLLLIDESFREVLPLLFEFFGVADPAHPAPLMDPEARQRQLFGVLRRVVQGTGQQPVVTMLEDLHWLDAGSEAFLAEWVNAIAPARGLLLLNFRPEYRAAWMDDLPYQQLPLSPLGPAAIDELLRDLVGDDASLAPLTASLRERTAGNPFFIEEVVQSLAETGMLVGSRGAYRLQGHADGFAIPSTVQAILAARIDRLPEGEKQVLQTAAVIGREFSEPLVLRVSADPADHDRAPTDVAATLRALVDAEFLYEQALYPVAEYAFKHPLTQEVAYGSQLAERRRRTHAAVARALEETEAAKLDEHAALIAHHWEAAGEPLVAARWHARAAAWAATSQLAASHEHWRAAHDLLAPLAPDAETDALRLAACVQLVNLGWRLATPRAETDAFFAEGQELAARTGDLRFHAALLSNYGLISTQDDLSRALTYYHEANRLADLTGDVTLRVVVGCMLAPLIFSGRCRQALQRAEEVLALTGSDPTLAFDLLHFSPYAWLRTARGFVLSLLGRVHEGSRELREAVALAERFPHGITRVVIHTYHADACFLMGDGAGALHHGRLGLEAAERTGSHFFRMVARSSLGAAHVLNGEWSEARPLLEEARTIATTFRLIATALPPLAEAYLGLGDAERARATATEAVTTSARIGSPFLEWWSQLARARIATRMPDDAGRGEATTALARATALAEQMGTRLFEPEILTRRAELAQVCGDADGRVRLLRDAGRRCVEMGLTTRAEDIAASLRSA